MSAPASMANSPVSGSLTTLAVRPAADEPLPDVYTARCANLTAYLRNCDLAVDGSPTMHTLMSPRRRVPSLVVLCTPPSSMSSMPFFTSSCPRIVGAMDETSRA